MVASSAQSRRLQMINGQLRTSDVNDLDILSAFERVPREAFVAKNMESLAYAEAAVPSTGPKGRKLLEPRALGLMMMAATPSAGEQALTIGAGSGYAAALLAEMGLTVTALETDAAASRSALAGWPRISIIEGSLTEVAKAAGPFDLIFVSGAFEVEPTAWVDVLSGGGRLVGLDARRSPTRVCIYERSGHGVSMRHLADAPGDVLPGFERKPTFAF